MSRKSPNLSMSVPKCRNCKRLWSPPIGVTADTTYCKKCAPDRQAAARSQLGLKVITSADLSGKYLFPRRLRPT